MVGPLNPVPFYACIMYVRNLLNSSLIILSYLFIAWVCLYYFSHRLLPHHQNTGGFFVAVMEKTAVLPWAKPRSVVPQEVGNNETTLTSVDLKTDADSAIETVATNLPDSSVEAETLNGEEGGAAVDEMNDIDDKADLFSDELVYDVGQDGDADSTSVANGGQRKRPKSGPE
jgi:hypothetical protein